MRLRLLALALPCVLACAPAEARKLGSLEFKPCDLAQQFQARVFEAECAYLEVP